MNNFEKAIIDKLLTKYQNSKLSKEGSDRDIKIKIDVYDPIMKSYQARDSYKYKDDNDEIIKSLTAKGYIDSSFTKDGDFQYLTLNIENVDDLYKYIGAINPRKENIRIIEYLNESTLTGYLEDFKNYILKYIDTKYTFPKSYFNDLDELKVLIKILLEINKLDDEVMKRDFSARVLGDSKKFVLYENKVVNILKEFSPDAKNIEKEDILKTFNIVSNYSYTLIKNKLIFKLKDTVFDLNNLPYEFSLSNQMIKDIQIIKSDIKRVITVENLTTFYALKEDALVIYLAGFHNTIKRHLLKRIYDMYPEAEYYHFSDIDAGGFWIYQNLKTKTKIPFKPYRMGVNELETNENNLKELTLNDVKRLKPLLANPDFKDFNNVIQYMLEHNCKLEQEVLD